MARPVQSALMATYQLRQFHGLLAVLRDWQQADRRRLLWQCNANWCGGDVVCGHKQLSTTSNSLHRAQEQSPLPTPPNQLQQQQQQQSPSMQHQQQQQQQPMQQQPTQHSARGREGASLDPREAAKFAALAARWWDAERGPFAPLHALNPVRCTFVRDGLCELRGLPARSAQPLAGLSVLDVGCGGGLLSEPLARMGAAVHGIDVSDEGVAAARAHADADPLLASRIRYERTTLEALVERGATYDVVAASEVLEHVRDPASFVRNLAAAATPGGQVFVTTLNRTPAAYAAAIVAAEALLRVVPAGTHDWERFVTPAELAMMARDAGLTLRLLAGMSLSPRTGRFELTDDTRVNYAALLCKPAA